MLSFLIMISFIVLSSSNENEDLQNQLMEERKQVCSQGKQENYLNLHLLCYIYLIFSLTDYSFLEYNLIQNVIFITR